jgi:hypothetical protein
MVNIPPIFVFDVVDGFRCDDSRDPHDGVFLSGKHFVCAILCFA